MYSGESNRLLPQRSRIYTEKELEMKLKRELPMAEELLPHSSQQQAGSGIEEDSKEPTPGMQD